MQCRIPQRYRLAASLLCVILLLGNVGMAHLAIVWPSTVAKSGAPGPAPDEGGATGGALSPGPYPYLIGEKNKCREGKEAPFLVLLITVQAQQRDRRDAIRSTWGNKSLELLPQGRQSVVPLFLLGGEKAGLRGRLQQMALESESLRHHDIIQQDFLDSYNNLTLKTLMGLNWVAMRCPQATFVMKTDSDVFVNTRYLVDKLLRLTPRVENYITGGILNGTGPIRDKRNKWYVSKDDYPGHTYPVYLSGTGYVFSGDLAAKIYNTSLSVPPFIFEDVHVGMRLAELGIEPTPPLPNEFNNLPVPWSGHGYSRLVTSHMVSPSDMLEFWTRLQH